MSTVLPRVDGWNAAVGGVVAPSAARGGTLRLVAGSDVDSLDPVRTYYVWVWLLQRMLNRTLVAYPTDPGQAGRVPVPDLAAGPALAEHGNRVWTYRLRPGVRFDDGREVTADDVAYGISRGYSRDVLPGGPTWLLDLLDDPDDPCGGPFGSAALRSVPAGVEVLDRHTVRFRLRRPFADFDHLLCQPAAIPVPRERDTGVDYGLAPASCGPYRVARYEAGRRLSLVRNEYWDPASDPIRPALPDRVEVTMGMTADELDDRLLGGEFDLDLESRGIQDTARRRILADEVLTARSDNPETGFLQFVAIHPFVAPLDNVHARRAIHYAADRLALQHARGGPIHGGDLAQTLFPPRYGIPNPGPRYAAGDPVTGELTGDLDAARAELRAAGLPHGFRATIGTQRGKFAAVAEALRDSVARVGIELDVELLDIAGYFATGAGSPATVRARNLGLVVNDWGADFPTPYGYLAPLVHGRFVPESGNFNTAELDDPGVNAAVDATLEATDPAEATRLWQQVQDDVMDRAVILPIVHDRTLLHRGPDATNVFVHPAFGLYDIQAAGVRAGARHTEQ